MSGVFLHEVITKMIKVHMRFNLELAIYWVFPIPMRHKHRLELAIYWVFPIPVHDKHGLELAIYWGFFSV